MSFKFNCQHGSHETVADAKACQFGTAPAPTALDKLSTQHVRNDLARATARSEQVRRSVLGTDTASEPETAGAQMQRTYSAPRYDAPAGHYAVEFEGQLRFFKVDRPTEGKWAGYVFIKEQASDDLYPIRNRQRREAILAAISEDYKAAGARYGQEIGRCYVCHRTLTDATSRELGIGPDCRSK
jgi:hypothetical protein